ncbi:hypothetical protein F511_24627 [Dorcoceras hygrometricum]|uniref:Uncharacterized protein n=1 Tax=Dorcoceras hygrometricum TaxID=472368 RepID=A0A2Z7BZQ3_9LAMI|nr:hypothetical protein F511_24627 [Dorcoceras hygrometricum]
MKPAAIIRRCILKRTSKRHRIAPAADNRFLAKQPAAGRSKKLKMTTFMTRHHRCQQLATKRYTKTLRFNLSKRRRVAPTTGSSNQQLVIQLGQFLTTQQLIALQFSSQHQNIFQHVALSRYSSRSMQLLPVDTFSSATTE